MLVGDLESTTNLKIIHTCLCWWFNFLIALKNVEPEYCDSRNVGFLSGHSEAAGSQLFPMIMRQRLYIQFIDHLGECLDNQKMKLFPLFL